MPTARRPRAERSTRETLLDAAERLVVTDGYAAVTYGRVATAADATKALVQYYFPKIDDLFVAMIERRGAESVEGLLARLDERPEEPLQVVWEATREEAMRAFTVEIMALANHRKSIRAQIAEIAARIRGVQVAAIAQRAAHLAPPFDQLSPEGSLFLLHAVTKLAALEESIGLTAGHEEVLALLDASIDAAAVSRKVRRRGVSRRPA